jgi:murein DD-endopeptidase MepM/ murein hydrolase activator NlpD
MLHLMGRAQPTVFSRFLPVLVLTGLVGLGACTRYKPIDWENSETWVAARARAYDEEAKHPSRFAAASAGAAARHLVMPGEMLSELADRYHVPMSRLIKVNNIKKPYLLYTGQVLSIPARGSPTLVATAGRPSLPALPVPRPDIGAAGLAVAQDAPIVSRPLAALVSAPADDADAAADDSVAAPAVDPREAELTRRASEEKPPSLTGDGFLWPVKGAVLSDFGAKPNGSRNDGINIAAHEGDPVRAAENGIVVYAGDAIPGFGLMLLIRHADGFTTAYAHNSRILVQIDDHVTRGQTIARVGTTGAVPRPQLHFELRAGKQPIDPAKHLVGGGTQVASSG